MILLVRDPRDVFLSMTAMDKKRGFPGFARRADDDDWTFARRFVKLCQQAFEVTRAEEANSCNILVKYERLALDLANESQRLSGTWASASTPASSKGRRRNSLTT